jgi:hypothetical protein
MPYGDLTPYRDPNAIARSASWPEPAVRQGLRVGIVSLALATLMSFVAGVGSTVVYFQSINEVPLAALPLIEADKTPSRVRPEGLDSNGDRLMASTPAPAPTSGSSLPSPISSAQAATRDPAVDLTPQGIPSAPEMVPPVAAAVIELAPPIPTATPPVPAASKAEAEVDVAATPLTDQFRLQLATMRSAEGARQEMGRLNALYASLTPALELSVQRLEQGERGVFYRVLSEPVGERSDASQLCAAIAERRGQCRIVAVVAGSAPAVAQAPKPVEPAPVIAASAPVPVPVAPVVVAAAPAPQTNPAAPVIAAKTAAMETAANSNGASSVRAQLGSMRSAEGAARELARLKEVHAGSLTSTELSISKIDQGDRGVFYRILTAPLPDRASASEFCKSLGPQHGCVLIPQRPSA